MPLERKAESYLKQLAEKAEILAADGRTVGQVIKEFELLLRWLNM